MESRFFFLLFSNGCLHTLVNKDLYIYTKGFYIHSVIYLLQDSRPAGLFFKYVYTVVASKIVVSAVPRLPLLIDKTEVLH